MCSMIWKFIISYLVATSVHALRIFGSEMGTVCNLQLAKIDFSPVYIQNILHRLKNISPVKENLIILFKEAIVKIQHDIRLLGYKWTPIKSRCGLCSDDGTEWTRDPQLPTLRRPVPAGTPASVISVLCLK